MIAKEKILGVKVSKDSKTLQIRGLENIETLSIGDEFKNSRVYYVDTVKVSFEVVDLPKWGFPAKFMHKNSTRVYFKELRDAHGELTDWNLYTQYLIIKTNKGTLKIKVKVKVRVKFDKYIQNLYQTEESKRVLPTPSGRVRSTQLRLDFNKKEVVGEVPAPLETGELEQSTQFEFNF